MYNISWHRQKQGMERETPKGYNGWVSYICVNGTSVHFQNPVSATPFQVERQYIMLVQGKIFLNTLSFFKRIMAGVLNFHITGERKKYQTYSEINTLSKYQDQIIHMTVLRKPLQWTLRIDASLIHNKMSGKVS